MTTADELLLGVDIGTSSTKAILATPDGRVIDRGTVEHRVSLPAADRAEHDPEGIWWTEFVFLARRLAADRADAIRAIGVSGIGPCVTPCDSNDRPLRPAILYGIDRRASAEIEWLEQQLGRDAILRRCGSTLSSQALGPKLLWIARHEPELWSSTSRWHMASSFVVARLTGEWALDHCSASQCDPFYDFDRRSWADDWAALVPGLTLPPLVEPASVVGRVHAAAAAETGLVEGTPVVAGTVDAWAEAASVGVRDAGDLMLMYGSTTFLILVAERRSPDPTVWNTVGVDSRSLCVAAGTATAGSLTDWVASLTGGPSFDTLTAAARDVPKGADGLLLLPYFAGERTPLNDPDARGVIVGLTLRHGSAHLYRAALEGTAFAVRHNLEVLGQRPRRVVAVGGGVKNDLWPEIVSNVARIEQEIPAETSGASYGDALLAAEGVGLIPPRSSWATTRRRVTPDPEQEPYEELYRSFRELHRATAPIQHALARASR